MRDRLTWTSSSGVALLALALSACSALLDTSSLGPGANDAGGSSLAGSESAGSNSGGSVAASGAASAGESPGGASAGGATGASGGAAAGGAPGNCKPTNKKELCDGIDNDCDAATPDVCPGGCSGFAVDGVGHMVCSKAVAFSSAQLACLNQSMYVVAPNTKQENDDVLAHTADLGAFVWLGAQDEQNDHQLQWPDSTVIATNGVPTPGVYNEFAAGQPAVLSGQNCLHMATAGQADAGEWSSVSCSSAAPFVCEPLF